MIDPVLTKEPDMVGKLDDYLRFNETALSLRSQRQQMLASNIANADTPNYKARDIDFSKAMHGAMKGPMQAATPGGTGAVKSVAMAVTAPMHLTGSTAALAAS